MAHRIRTSIVATLLGIAWAGVPVMSSLSAQAEISGGVVKLGVLTDETGVFSSLSGEGSVEAARMAVEDFGGKAAGKPIEIIHADHQNKPDIGAAIARRWIDVDAVDAIVDMPNSAVVLAVQQLAKEHNRVLLVSTAGTPISRAKHLRRTLSIAAGSTQSLKGTPLRRAPGLRASTGT